MQPNQKFVFSENQTLSQYMQIVFIFKHHCKNDRRTQVDRASQITAETSLGFK
jgi:hypothetical protein